MISSACPKKNICGSCSWSHLPYDVQLKQKLADVNGSLALKGLAFQCHSIIPAPRTAHYRNRMDFAIDFEGRVGLKEKGKWWRVIDGHACFLAMQSIDELFKEVRTWVRESALSCWDRKAHTGLLRYAVIRASTQGETMVSIITSVPQDEHEEQQARLALATLASRSGASTLIWIKNSTITDVSFGDILEVVSESGFITQDISGIQYRISPQAFFQTNPYAAPLLLDAVKEFCGDLRQRTLLDLYCGTGFFSVALAHQTRRTVGVELSSDAIADAKINASLNNVSVEYHDAKTEDFAWESVDADVVILDPPRSGMHDRALAEILRVLPQTIVYVSCNPKNFAREMVQLQRHYAVEAMRAIDMFPHTPHVELVTRMVKIAR